MIKYRAWDTKRKIMLGSDYPENWEHKEDEYYMDWVELELTRIEELNKNPRFILMQCTGSKAKYDISIYKSDIFSLEVNAPFGRQKDIYIVEFRAGCFMADNTKNKNAVIWPDIVDLMPWIKVLGNTHENYNLLDN